jgi:hypothetical protein
MKIKTNIKAGQNTFNNSGANATAIGSAGGGSGNNNTGIRVG